MTKIFCSSVRLCGLVGLIAALSASQAQADETTSAPSSTPTSTQSSHAAIAEAIENEKARRATAIGGFVVGGLCILSGTVVSAVASSENQTEKDNGQATTHNAYVGYAIGLGAGLPIMGLSAYLFSDAQHKINTLNRQQQLSLVRSPETGQPMLQLSFSY